MDNQIDEVKNKTDIVGLIGEYTPLKKAGRNYKALCPFHSEKTPSFMVSPDRQIFKCFGCGEGGDAFAFYKRIEGVEFGEALKTLSIRAGILLKEYKPTKQEQQKELIFKLHDLASQLYHYLLTKHPSGKKAMEYLKSRGIKPKAISDFRLGYAPDRRDTLLKYLKKKEYSIQDAVNAGLLLVSGSTPIDRFRGRIMFPIFDSQNRVIAFSGRGLGNIEPKYMNSPDTPIFSKSRALYGINLAKSEIKKEKNAILVEGNLDVISSSQVGVGNVVAPLGTALTLPQIEMIKRWTETILFAFDRDLAGDIAAKRAIELSVNEGMNVRAIQLSEGKDPDESIRKNPLTWKKGVKEATPIHDYFIESAIRKYGSSGSEEKKRVASEVLPEIAKINDVIIKAHYTQILGSKLAIDEDIIRQALKKYSSGEKAADYIKEVLDKPLSIKGSVLIEKYLLALIIQSGVTVEDTKENFFNTLRYQEIYTLLADFIKKEKRL